MMNAHSGMPELSDCWIRYIFGAYENGSKQATIAKQIGCGQNTMSRILRRYNPDTFTTHDKRSGPKKKNR